MTSADFISDNIAPQLMSEDTVVRLVQLFNQLEGKVAGMESSVQDKLDEMRRILESLEWWDEFGDVDKVKELFMEFQEILNDFEVRVSRAETAVAEKSAQVGEAMAVLKLMVQAVHTGVNAIPPMIQAVHTDVKAIPPLVNNATTAIALSLETLHHKIDSLLENTGGGLGLPVLTGEVTILGENRTDAELLADTQLLQGTGSVSFEWRRVDGRGEYGMGTLVGTDQTYVPQDGDIGYALRVIVSRQRFFGRVASEPTGAIVVDPLRPLEVPGGSIANQFQWLRSMAQDETVYLVTVHADESVTPAQVMLPTGRTNLTVILRGIGEMRTVSLSENGSLFTVGSGVTLVLDDGVSLQGRSANNNSLVLVNSGGTLVVNTGARITGNTTTTHNTGGGVSVDSGGVFILDGGEVSGNSVETLLQGMASAVETAGGITNRGTFNMLRGEVSGNSCNVARVNIGPVAGGIANTGTVNMFSGKVSGNFLTLRGEGTVWVPIIAAAGGITSRGTFNMLGGEVSGNVGQGSSANGQLVAGGVFAPRVSALDSPNIFRIVSGVIYGQNASDAQRNRGWGSMSGVDAHDAIDNTHTPGISPVANVFHGTFSADGDFASFGSIGSTNNTVRVENGFLHPWEG